MRTRLVRGLAALSVLALAACHESYPQQPKDPINANPTPQAPINNPTPQPRGPGLDETPGTALNNPSPQPPALNAPGSTEPMDSAGPQKPFYGPGLPSPDERADAAAKAKAPLASDGEVVSFLIAVNDGEVQMAEMAKKAADDKDVKNFAAMMSTQHQQGLAKIRAVQSKTKIEAKNNDLTQHLKGEVNQDTAMLRDKKGSEFDRLYMNTQVRLHKEALDAFDNRVIPAITNGELKKVANDERRTVSDHLSHAEDLLKKLDPQAAAAISSDSAYGTTSTTSATMPNDKSNKSDKDKDKDNKNDTKKKQ